MGALCFFLQGLIVEYFVASTMTTCLPEHLDLQKMPTSNDSLDEKEVISPDGYSTESEKPAPLGAPIEERPEYLWQRVWRPKKDLDSIATQPSVFEDPKGLEAYRPPANYEHTHRFDPAARWTWREEHANSFVGSWLTISLRVSCGR